MLNYETLLSSYDDKLTLMQWLKKVEAALKGASAVSFKVNKKGDATLTFSIVFEDGSELESGEIILQQGESVESAAIVNGHLILTLTNGDELDAGQLLNGDLNVSGNLAVTGKITGAEIVENMTGYSYTPSITSGMTTLYAGIVKTGNKITAVVSLMFTPDTDISAGTALGLGKFNIPASIGSKLIPFTSQTLTNVLDIRTAAMNAYVTLTKGANLVIYKSSNTQLDFRAYPLVTIQGDGATNYYIRYEATFLLSENLAA